MDKGLVRLYLGYIKGIYIYIYIGAILGHIWVMLRLYLRGNSEDPNRESP